MANRPHSRDKMYDFQPENTVLFTFGETESNPIQTGVSFAIQMFG